jgi:hypothetical protein
VRFTTDCDARIFGSGEGIDLSDSITDLVDTINPLSNDDSGGNRDISEFIKQHFPNSNKAVIF